ncbi:MAG: hypothetical protein JWN67_3276 [Actinomycetia bacterium]|nr:hypothetical protein [Actinomycetes bacterium]
MSYRVALTGDAILNTRVSSCADREVLDVLDLLRGADVAYGHVEIPLHDFATDDTFPSAEGALSWMCAPTVTAEELRWCGLDIVSTASNHSFDFSFGGLLSTLDALDAVDLPHAGTGADLGAARAPAFVDTAVARVGLVSAVSSFPMAARAGAARVDMRGRPGVNGLRHHHVVDPSTATELVDLYGRLGWWVTRAGDELAVNPPGLHNSLLRFVVDDRVEGITTRCDEDDLAGNVQAIRHAASAADFVIAHLHSHEWEATDGRLGTSPAFVREYAHAAVEAGASVVVVQGSHAPFRGIEVHRGVPILHDPGPLFRQGRRNAQPQDFYVRWGNGPAARAADAGILEAFEARAGVLGGGPGTHEVLHPREGVAHEPGFFVPVCEVDDHHRVTAIAIHPASWSGAPTKAASGFPRRLTGTRATAVLEHLRALSAPFGTEVQLDGDTGRIEVGR